jgi:CYTH domain-containing protein
MEMPSEDFKFEFPDWVGKEVTDDPRYLNTNLSKKPIAEWP